MTEELQAKIESCLQKKRTRRPLSALQAEAAGRGRQLLEKKGLEPLAEFY